MEYKLDGRYMTVKIAKSDLGLSGNDYTINFAWTDNVHDEGDYSKFSGDILDFYLSGDVAPGGRFKYSFISTAENSGVPAETTPETAPVTEPEETPTEQPAIGETEAPADVPAPEAPAETDTAGKGCKSTLGMGMAATLVAMAAAVALKKKENE